MCFLFDSILFSKLQVWSELSFGLVELIRVILWTMELSLLGEGRAS